MDESVSQHIELRNVDICRLSPLHGDLPETCHKLWKWQAINLDKLRQSMGVPQLGHLYHVL